MIGPEDLRRERYTTGQIGKLVGKNYHTIALHKNKGMINMVQDPVSGFWYADKKDLIDYLKKLGLWNNSEKKNAIYARVSSHDQKKHGDLDRQIGRLCQKASGAMIFSDVGSGLNTERKGLNKLIDEVIHNKIDVLYITHKDRLTRFGYGYLEKFFNAHGVKIIVTEDKPDKNYQEELVDDMMSLLAFFSGQMYGMRRSQRKKIAQQAKEAIEEPLKQEETKD